MENARLYATDRYTALDNWQTVRCAAHLEMLDEVARMDQEGIWGDDGAASMAHWLVNRYGLSHRTATEWVRVAHSVQELPSIRAAYHAGRMSWDQVRTATRFATPATDDKIAREAPGLTVRELSRMARTVKLRDVQEAHRDRSFTFKFDDELPVLWMNGRMPASDGVEFVKAITRLAGTVPADPNGTYEPFEARCLDAVLMLASQSRGADSDPDRATAVVHIPLSVLTDDEGHAESEEGVPLVTETARRLVCDARLQVSIENNEGTVIGVGRTTRSIPPWLSRLIRMRDKGCRFLGCGRTRWIHIHHIVHWAHGGPTDLDNLISLCPFHHHLIHEGGWRISGDPNGEVVWVNPGGQPFVPGASTLLLEGIPVGLLDDCLIPDHLKVRDPDDTS